MEQKAKAPFSQLLHRIVAGVAKRVLVALHSPFGPCCMRIACAVEVTHARNEDLSTWQREEVEVSINGGKPTRMFVWFKREAPATPKVPSPVAVPARASPPLPPSPPVDESEMEALSAADTVEAGSTPEMSPSSSLSLGPVPTEDSLGEDVVTPGWKSVDEWEPFSEAEMATIGKIAPWLGSKRFRAVPYDTLAAFLRGYSYRQDWPEASFVYLDRMLKWRSTYGQDVVLSRPNGFDEFAGPRRAEFDRALPAGCLGRDVHGHPVVFDRFCQLPVKRFLGEWTDEEFFRQMVARREGVRAVAADSSFTNGKRVYKVIAVVDLHGLGWAHLTDKTFHARMKAFNGLFSWHYPESTYKLVVINAPHVFSGLWKIAKLFVHPVTAAKVTVYSGNVKRLFDEMGIVLEEGVEINSKGQLQGNPPLWKDTIAKLVAKHGPEKLARCYAPEADVCAVEKLWGTVEAATAPAPLPAPASSPATSSSNGARAPTPGAADPGAAYVA